MKILNDLNLHINRAEIKKRLRLDAASDDWQHVQDLVQEVERLIKPQCAFKACYIQEKGHDAVLIADVRFESRVLRKNLEDAEKAFPFVLTLGAAIEERTKAEQDFLDRYYLDTIANVALQDGIKQVITCLQQTYKLEKLSYMSVGSLQDWPIEQQRQLFTLLGDVEAAIGVRLAPSMLMHPEKSESGMLFPSEATFLNCQLCPREACPSRKTPFDAAKAREYGVLDKD